VDERYVPPTDIASNEHMIREALVSRIALPANNFHPMYSPESLVQSAQKYSNQIATHVGRFDIIILGLGDDGHTASLFQVPYMYESMDMVLPIHNSPKPPAERLTLSYDTINNARNILFLVTGASKSDVLFRVIDNDSTLPATHIYPKDGTLTIVHATTDQ
jgi:6-phosphogluconolactonase